MALTETQDINYKYFKDHLNEWLGDLAYKDKYVVIYEQKIQQIQDDFSQAFKYAISNFPREEFIIQQVVSEDSINNFLSPAS